MTEISKEELIKRLERFVCENMLKKPDFELAPDEPLLSSGLLRSINLVELAVFVEKEFGVYVPDTEFGTEKMDNLESMASLVLKYRE